MAKDATVNVRIERELKSKVEYILEDLGTNTSNLISMLFKQVIKHEGIPFEIKLESKEVSKRRVELANVINSTGGKVMSKRFEKIVSLYAKGDIDYDVALYAIKKEFSSEGSL